MADYRIEDIRWAVGDMVFDACGPHDTGIAAEITAEGNKGTIYLSCLEFEGYPNFFRTDKPLFDILRSGEKQMEHSEELEAMRLDMGDYTDIFGDEKIEDRELFRALIYVIRAETGDANAFCSEARGRLLSELTIPLCDIEQDWLDELAAEEAAEKELLEEYANVNFEEMTPEELEEFYNKICPIMRTYKEQ